MHADAQPPLLRAGLLDGQLVALAGGEAPFGSAAADACGALGATIARLHPADPLDETAVEEAVQTALERDGAIDTLIVDAAGGSGAAGVDDAWLAIRAVATTAMIPDARGGKVVLIAPPPGTEAQAATRAAAENMVRTLSIEWARHGIRPTCVRPGAAGTPADVATLVAYLASPAGDFFSGCVLEPGAAG